MISNELATPRSSQVGSNLECLQYTFGALPQVLSSPDMQCPVATTPAYAEHVGNPVVVLDSAAPACHVSDNDSHLLVVHHKAPGMRQHSSSMPQSSATLSICELQKQKLHINALFCPICAHMLTAFMHCRAAAHPFPPQASLQQPVAASTHRGCISGMIRHLQPPSTHHGSGCACITRHRV